MSHSSSIRHDAERVVILVGDRDDDARSILSRALDHAGYSVRLATDGDALLREARADRVALVVAELYLACASGRCAVQCLKSDPALRHIPVLVFTTQVFAADEKWARDVGAERFLRKPVDFGTLFSVVKEMIDPGVTARPTRIAPVREIRHEATS